MEKIIQKYLSEHYVVSNADNSSKSIMFLSYNGIYRRNDNSKLLEIKYGTDLIDELLTIFSLNKRMLKSVVNKWAKINYNTDLKWYWKQQKIFIRSAISYIEINFTITGNTY